MRPPKIDEIWIGEDSKRYQCKTDPGSDGKVAWLQEDGRLRVGSTQFLVPPENQRPENLTYWVNIYPGDDPGALHRTDRQADEFARSGRVGRIDAYGKWVPCDGAKVLG